MLMTTEFEAQEPAEHCQNRLDNIGQLPVLIPAAVAALAYSSCLCFSASKRNAVPV